MAYRMRTWTCALVALAALARPGMAQEEPATPPAPAATPVAPPAGTTGALPTVPRPPPELRRSPPPASEIESLRGSIAEMPEVVVRDIPLRLEGPLESTVSVSPLGFGAGPVVALRAGGARDVLSPRRVREYTPTTVEGVAARLPGVSSRLYSGDEYMRPSISLRGMPDNGFTEYTAVLVDGFNMSTLAYGWTAISIFPFTAERIWAAEVYRGAFAIRYGPNTIGGVVNFVTQPIPEQPSFRERLMFGSNNYLATVTEAGGMDRSGRFGALVTYVDKGGDTFRDDNRFDANELALKLLWNVNRRTWIEFDGAHWRAVHQIPGRLTREQLDEDPAQNPNPHEVDWHGWSYWGTLTVHHDFGRDAWAEAFLYHRLAQRALDSARPANPPYTAIRSADSDNYNSGVELRGEFPLCLGIENRIHWGARYHREQIDRTTFDDPIGGGPRNVTQESHTINHALSANIDDTVRLGRITLTAGLRADWVVDSFAEDEVTGGTKGYEFFDVFPGGSVVFDLTPCWVLFGNGHTGFRAPQTWSYDFTRDDQRLDNEHGTDLEVGTRWENVRGLSGSVVLWQVDYSDFIQLDPDLDVVTNFGGYTSRGVDVVVEAELGAWARPLRGWSLFGNATRQDSEINDGENDGQRTPFVPQWVAAGGVRYEHCSGLYGVMDSTYQGSSYVTPENDIDTPDYALLNARIGWHRTFNLGRLRLEADVAVAAKNLLDKDYYLRHDANKYVPGVPREFFFELAFGLEF